MPSAPSRQTENLFHSRLTVTPRRYHLYRGRHLTQRGCRPCRVEPVPLGHVADHLVPRDGIPLRLQLEPPAPGPLLGGGGEEDLQLRIGEDDAPHIPTIH